VNGEDAAGRTALHCAAEAGSSSAVKILLERGKAHNLTELHARQPLHP
jgi:ankyrin repeat protein